LIEQGQDESVDFFNKWVSEVQEFVPRDRLLVFEVKDGWKPLCDFLGLPQPEEPFPNVNDSESMKRKYKMMKLVPRMLVLGIAVLFLAIILQYMSL